MDPWIKGRFFGSADAGEARQTATVRFKTFASASRVVRFAPMLTPALLYSDPSGFPTLTQFDAAICRDGPGGAIYDIRGWLGLY